MQGTQSTVNNLAFRDYFKGAVATHNTYLDGEIISESAHVPTAVIAVPVYSSEKGGEMLSGVWGDAINLMVLYKITPRATQSIKSTCSVSRPTW